MNLDKLQKHNYHDEPVEHFCAVNIIELSEYDRLYENQNDLNHTVWKEFCRKHNTKATRHDNFNSINFDRDVICLWFFKDRNDRTAAHVQINGKQIRYNPNVFLITRSKSIKMFYADRKYIHSPVIQLDMTIENYDSLVKKFQK